MQHEHVLRKLIFDSLTPSQGCVRGGGGLRVKYLLPCCCVCHSLKFDMQHDDTLKKLSFDFFTPPSRVGKEGSACKMFATMWLHSWFILFDMQHDHILKKLNLTVRPPPPGSGGLHAKYLLPCCCMRHSLL